MPLNPGGLASRSSLLNTEASAPPVGMFGAAAVAAAAARVCDSEGRDRARDVLSAAGEVRGAGARRPDGGGGAARRARHLHPARRGLPVRPVRLQ